MHSTGPTANQRATSLVALFLLTLFTVLFALAGVLSAGWAGSQPFLRYRVLEQAPRITITAGLPLEVSLDLTRAAPRAIRFLAGPGQGGSLRVQVFDGERRIGASSIQERGLARVELESLGEPITNLRLVFQTQTASPSAAPWVARAGVEPVLEGHALQGGQPSPAVPLLWFEHPSPARGLLACWLGIPLLLLLAWRRPRWTPLALAGLSVAATIASVALWELFVSGSNAAGDPDGYGRAAQRILAWFRLPREREAVSTWFHRYPHAQTSLVSVLLLAPMALGASMKLAYVALNACLSASTLALFVGLGRQLGLDARARLLALGLLAGHLLFLRGFARPSPDALGLFLVVASLWLLVRRRATGAGDGWLPCLYLAHLVARPQGPAVCLFLFAAVIWVDVQRAGWAEVRRRALFHVLSGAVPVLLVLGMYIGFGWFHNLELSFEKAAVYRSHYTLFQLGTALLAVLQILPLFWFGGRARDAARVPSAPPNPSDRGLFWAWICFYLALLLVVRAPLWPRHFLPLLPAAILLALRPGDDRGASRTRTWALWALAAVNVVVVVGTTVFFLEGISAYQEQRLPELVYQMLYE